MKKLNRSPQRKNKIIFEGFFSLLEAQINLKKKIYLFYLKSPVWTGRTSRLGGGGGGSREAGHFVILRFSHVKLASNRFDVDNFTFISHNKTMIIDDGFISTVLRAAGLLQHVTMDFQILDILLPVFFREIVITPARHLHA